MGLCRPVEGRPEKHIILEGIQFDVVELFHDLGDKICPEGGYELPTIARTRVAWGGVVNCFLFLHLLRSL